MSTTTAATVDDNRKLHIAMFPWLAFGHMIPYLELAKFIASKGHKISFVSTPKNIERLPKLPPSLVPYINFIKIPLPKHENLPENAEATTDLPYDKVQYLKTAYDSTKDAMAEFLESSRPDCVFFDFALYWLASIAAKLKIPSAFFSIMIAAVLGYLGPADALMGTAEDYRKTPEEFAEIPKWVPFKTSVTFRLYEVLKMIESFTGDDSGVSDIYRFGASMQACDFIAVRSCSEFEPEWLRVVEDLHKKPAIPVGQLPPFTVVDDDATDTAWPEIKSFLDKQERGSVVYVAFGSEAKPSQDELNEIALGLELSGLPFFWVLRMRRGSADTELLQLPTGFEERVSGRGIVWTSWVPQLKILSHDSVGGFLTHSGWSSVVEAIEYEKALILQTFLADQGLNARLLEEKRMGYPIPRDERDGSFTRNSVAESLSLVMVEEEGKVYRDKVKEMKGLFGDRDRQYRYVDKLIQFLQSHLQGVR